MTSPTRIALPVQTELRGPAFVITIDNPPVNALGRAVRAALSDAIEAARVAIAKGQADRVVLTGAGRNFIAGADAREFDGPALQPHLSDIIARLAELPAIAAINGPALGGGFEVALACRFRTGAPKALVGLPEVTLGVVPGAGGTQRLPRLIGLAAAPPLVSTGQTLRGSEAVEIGMIDECAEDPLAAALALDPQRLSRPPLDEWAAPDPAPEALAAACRHAETRLRGQLASLRAIDLMEAASTRPLAEAMAEERAAFLELRAGPQARALRHVFFAERSAGTPVDIATLPAAPITSALVAGGGTMGAAIAYALHEAGLAITLLESDQAAENRAKANLCRFFDEAVARGKLAGEEAKRQFLTIRFLHGAAPLPVVDVAIEAIYEDMAAKRSLFARLADQLAPTTLLATNTSYLDVDEIFAGIAHPERCLGLHFFAPAHLMRLVEVIRAKATAPATLAAGFALTRRLGKIAVDAGVCDGFIGNRILTRYRQAADAELLRGADPAGVDAAMQGYGMAMGPYAAQDLSGLDIAHANRQRKRDAGLPLSARESGIGDRLVALGRLGRKTGKGWFDHAGGSPAPSAEVAAVIRQQAAASGMAQTPSEPQRFARHLVLSMIAEGCDILTEGIARSPADIDVLIHGYGFPRWRGGPMRQADEWGLAEVLDDLRRLAADDPVMWNPPPLLERLVAEGRDFADPDRTGL